jgi:hypothetical protein
VTAGRTLSGLQSPPLQPFSAPGVLPTVSWLGARSTLLASLELRPPLQSMTGGGCRTRQAGLASSPRVLSPSAHEVPEVHLPGVPRPRFVPLSAFLTLSGVFSFRNPRGPVPSHKRSWGSTRTARTVRKTGPRRVSSFAFTRACRGPTLRSSSTSRCHALRSCPRGSRPSFTARLNSRGSLLHPASLSQGTREPHVRETRTFRQVRPTRNL